MRALSIYDSPYVMINTDKLKELIEIQDLKFYWVAEMSGIHKTTLRRWFSGQIRRVREENVISLAKVLNVPVDVLIH